MLIILLFPLFPFKCRSFQNAGDNLFYYFMLNTNFIDILRANHTGPNDRERLTHIIYLLKKRKMHLKLLREDKISLERNYQSHVQKLLLS